jgi:hypothetical protein
MQTTAFLNFLNRFRAKNIREAACSFITRSKRMHCFLRAFIIMVSALVMVLTIRSELAALSIDSDDFTLRSDLSSLDSLLSFRLPLLLFRSLLLRRILALGDRAASAVSKSLADRLATAAIAPGAVRKGLMAFFTISCCVTRTVAIFVDLKRTESRQCSCAHIIGGLILPISA